MFSALTRRTLMMTVKHQPPALPTTTSLLHRTATRALADAAAKPPSRRRRTLTDAEKDPILVTPRAAERIKELLESRKDNDEPVLGIRLGVRRRGCNGLSYTLNYVHDPPAPKDIHMTGPSGIQLWIDPMALFNIVGTTMDWEETELSSEFTFSNPNSRGGTLRRKAVYPMWGKRA